MAGSALCRLLHEPLRRPQTAATAVRWLRRASALREGRRRPVRGRQLHRGAHRLQRRRGHGSWAKGERRAGRPTPIGHPVGLVQPGATSSRRAPDSRGGHLVGSITRGARWGACGPPRAPCHAEYVECQDFPVRGAGLDYIDRRLAVPAGATGRRPDMRSSARSLARILRSWPATWHPLPHRLRPGTLRLWPCSPSDCRRRPSRFMFAAGVPAGEQRSPWTPCIRPRESSVAPAIVTSFDTATGAHCVASGARHRRLAILGPSAALS